jgi:hypothetical protein
MLVEVAWAAAETPGPLRDFYERVRARRGMQVAVVAAARKLATLCWRLVVTGQDYAFARPSLTDKKLRALELRAGLPARPGQKGKAAAYSLKEVRRRCAGASGRSPSRPRSPTVNSWPAGSRSRQPSSNRRGAWPPPLGHDVEALKGQSCAAGLPASRPCSLLRGRPRPTLSLTTPKPAGNATPALKLSSVLRSLEWWAAEKA